MEVLRVERLLNKKGSAAAHLRDEDGDARSSNAAGFLNLLFHASGGVVLRSRGLDATAADDCPPAICSSGGLLTVR